jgi:hypothetical protein
MTDSSGVHDGAPIAVVLHERLGNWARQLRPRLHDLPIRWFETRSANDLSGAIDGLAAPVVLIDLGKDPAGPLEDLAGIAARNASARVLVLDSENREGIKELARELGATHVLSGFAAPPAVADLVARWVTLAAVETERTGWSRTLPVDPVRNPTAWIDGLIAQAENSPAPTPSPQPPPADC